MLISAIDDNYAGRVCLSQTHIAPAPVKVESMIKSALSDYSSDLQEYFLEKIAKFYLGFGDICIITHPMIAENSFV